MSVELDVQSLILPDTPPEWPDLPPVLVAALRDGSGILIHDRRCRPIWQDGFVIAHRCVGDCPVWQSRQVLAGRWFLVVNDAVPGYKPRCTNCGQRHTYMTYRCVEKPYNGLTELVALLTEPRVEGNDRITEGFHFGKLVPITAAKAAELHARIRARGGIVD